MRHIRRHIAHLNLPSFRLGKIANSAHHRKPPDAAVFSDGYIHKIPDLSIGRINAQKARRDVLVLRWIVVRVASVPTEFEILSKFDAAYLCNNSIDRKLLCRSHFGHQKRASAAGISVSGEGSGILA